MLTKKPVKNSEKVSVLFEFNSFDNAESIHIAGDFNAWTPDKTPLKKRRDGTWSVAVRLPRDSRHEYRLVVDGQWRADDCADDLVPNPFGGHNSVVSV